MKRALSIFLLCAILASCGEAVTPSEDTTTGTTAEETTGLFDGIEAEDYDGREFKFLFRAQNESDWYTEEENGDVYNDAVYARNQAIEEEFNIHIVPISEPGEHANRVEFTNRIRTSVLSGSGDYDLVEMNGANGVLLTADHLLLNLHEVEHLRLNKPWWSERSVKEMTINGKMFYATGDIAIGMWDFLHVFYFNKELHAQYQLEDLYQLVKDGKWTYDVFLRMIENVAADLNGDSQMTDDDRFGALLFDDISFENFRVAFDAPIIVRTSDTIELNLVTEKLSAITDRMRALRHENPNVHFTAMGSAGDHSANLFAENHSLFLVGWLLQAENLRSMDADFGILPYPKADEDQDGYYTMSRASRSMMCIPLDASDSAFSGKITEALAVAGSKLVIPVYQNQVLDGKTARDEESQEMLEIIRNGLTLDIISDYSDSIGSAGYLIRNAVNGNKSLATEYASKESKINTQFEEFLKWFE
ncbi:MAG: hypothetical protein E7632_01055 [Ruminococcaceae bacterium]|nr:hypothetical protein [Oscillospiraceae bacterium]